MFQPIALPASRVVARIASFRPRKDRDDIRAKQAADRARADGGNAMDAALASIGAVGIHNEAFLVNLFKMRIDKFIELGAKHPAVQARFDARARMLNDILSSEVVVTSGMQRRFEIAARNAEFISGPAASGAVWPEQADPNGQRPGDLTRPLRFSSPQGEARGGVESRNADGPIGARGLTDVRCKWSPSRREGETTLAAGVATGPRALNSAIAAVERWYLADRKAFQIASAFGGGNRLSLEVLKELRLVLRLLRFTGRAGQFHTIMAGVLGESPQLAFARGR